MRMEIAKNRRPALPCVFFGGNQQDWIDLEMARWVGGNIVRQNNIGNRFALPQQKPAAFHISGLVRPIEQLPMLLP